MALTAKREKFLLELLRGKSQREAYRAAFDAARMKESTIDQCACKLLKDPKVAARYAELQDKVQAEAERKGIASAVEVLEELSDIALGRKEFPAYDMFGKEMARKPSMTARLRALELLGKNHALFTDKMERTGEATIRVVMDEDVRELAE